MTQTEIMALELIAMDESRGTENTEEMKEKTQFGNESVEAIIRFDDLYEFRQFLGKGGFGQVVLATHRDTNKQVALKIVNTKEESAARGLRSEAKILQKLPRHQNVVGFVQLHEYKNYLILAIEYA